MIDAVCYVEKRIMRKLKDDADAADNALCLHPRTSEGYQASTRLHFFFSSRRRHTRLTCDWSSDVCSSDLEASNGLPLWNFTSGRRWKVQAWRSSLASQLVARSGRTWSCASCMVSRLKQ